MHFFETRNYHKFAKLKNFDRAIYSCDFSEISNKLAIGCGDSTVHIMNYIRDLPTNRSSTKASEQGMDAASESTPSVPDQSISFQYDEEIKSLEEEKYN